VTSKNLLAIQLTQKEEDYQVLLQKKEELEADLKEATTPLKIDGGKKDGRKGIAT